LTSALSAVRSRRAGSHREPGLEATEVGVHLNPFGADRLAIRVAAERQGAGAGERAEQDRVRLGPVLAGERQRVERDELLRKGAGRRLELLDRIDAASSRDLLVDRVETMGAGDDRRPARRRESELDRAADLEKLRGQQDVERSRHGIEGEDRRVVRPEVPLGGELHVVGR